MKGLWRSGSAKASVAKYPPWTSVLERPKVRFPGEPEPTAQTVQCSPPHGFWLQSCRTVHNLIQDSVLRAYLGNATILSLSSSLFFGEDALSPYMIFDPFPVSSVTQPHSLTTTDTQRSILHAYT